MAEKNQGINYQMRDALGVITQDPIIRKFLEKKDPMALRQANSACNNYDKNIQRRKKITS